MRRGEGRGEVWHVEQLPLIEERRKERRERGREGRRKVDEGA